jgi:hypothetical protein
MEVLEPSVNDLMWECYQAAIKIAYLDDEYIHIRPQPSSISDELFDEIWTWTDGHYQKSFFDRMEGRCSLAAFHSFSIEKEEKYMQGFLARLQNVLPL